MATEKLKINEKTQI